MVGQVLKFLFDLTVRTAKKIAKAQGKAVSSFLREKVQEMKNKKVMGVVQVRFDERTCKVCRRKQGKQYTFPGTFTVTQALLEVQRIMMIVVQGGSPRVAVLPKYHPRCRCTVKLKIV
jgi:hypothetical protein